MGDKCEPAIEPQSKQPNQLKCNFIYTEIVLEIQILIKLI